MSEWSDIIDAVSAHVTLLKELGEKSIPLRPDTLAGFDEPTVTDAGGSSAPSSSPATANAAATQATPAASPAPVIGGKVEPKVDPNATREQNLASLAQQIDACACCVLRENRTKSVPGQGNPNSPDVLFIGEAPGADEDQQGLAFVGRAGQFLTKMIEAMGYRREDVFIANICKCRPPGNRTPMPNEMMTCFPFQREQIKIIQPKTIVLLGNVAAKALLDTQTGITRLQGQWTSYEGIPVMPTYHPSYVIRFAEGTDDSYQVKRKVWHALLAVLERLGKKPPARKKQEGK